jgi:hypothetical protein
VSWTFRFNGEPIESRQPSIECRRRIGLATSSSGRKHFRSCFKTRYRENGERFTISVKGTRKGNRPRATEWQSRIRSMTSYMGRNRFRSTFKAQCIGNGKRWSFAFNGANEAYQVSAFSEKAVSDFTYFRSKFIKTNLSIERSN